MADSTTTTQFNNDVKKLKFDNKPTKLLTKKEWNPQNYSYQYTDMAQKDADAVSDMLKLYRTQDLATTGARLTKIYQLNPNMHPSVALALAKNNASPAAVNAVGQAQIKGGLPQAKPVNPDANESGFYTAFKGLVRGGTIGLSAGWEVVGNALRLATSSQIEGIKKIAPDWYDNQINEAVNNAGWKIGKRGLDISSVWEGTQAWQVLANHIDSGTGFLTTPEVLQAAEKVAEDTLSVHGKGWTLGRGLASNLHIDPESAAYTAVSGTMDFFASFMLDPTIVGGKISASAKAAQSVGKLAEATAAANRAQELALTAEQSITLEAAVKAAHRAAGTSRMSLDEAANQLNREYANYQKMMLDADAIYQQGKYAGRTDDEIEVLRQTTNLDGLLAERATLEAQAAAVRSGNVGKTVAAVVNDEGMQWLKSEARRTKQSVSTVISRVGLQTLRESGFLAVGAESVTQAAARITREALVQNQQDLYDAALKTYGTKIDEIYFPGARAAAEADLNIAKKAVEQRQLALNAWVNRARNPQEQLAFIERMKAGLLDKASEQKINTAAAAQWFAGNKADVVFEAIANIDSAALIQRLSKGKFGIQLSYALSKATTAAEVEKILVGQIGATVNNALKRGDAGRIIQAGGVTDMPFKVQASTLVSRKIEAMQGRFRTTDFYVPQRTFISYNDLDGLALNAERWMTMARVTPEVRSQVINKIAALTDEENIFIRSAEAHKIMTGMLDDVAKRYTDNPRTTKVISQAINDASRAFESELSGLRTYAAEGNAKGRYDFEFTVDGKTISLSDTILSPTDMAAGITLPNIREFRQAIGRVRSAISQAENIFKKDKDAVAFQNAFAKAQDAAYFIFDDVLRTSLLVFRGAFLLRNIGEMMVRQALSPRSISAGENPLLHLAMVTSDPNSSSRLLQAFNRTLGKHDPLVLDINGKPFYDAAQEATFGMPQETMNNYINSISSRMSSIDGRVYRQHPGIFNRVAFTGSNAAIYSKGWAGELMKFHADPIKRAIASGELPTLWAGRVARGEITYEQGFVRALMAGDIPGVEKETLEAFINANEKLKNVLTSGEENRIKFFLGREDKYSYLNEIDRITLGIDSLREFIATGKIDDTVNKIALSADYNVNSKNITKAVSKYLDDAEIAQRAKDSGMLFSGTNELTGGRKLVEQFFDFSSRMERRAIYGPEYRVAYWNAVSDLAAHMHGDAATKILENAAEALGNSKFVVKGKEIPFSKFAEKKIQALEKAKTNTSGMSFKDVDGYANSVATKQVANLFYDAAKQNRLAYALRLIMPFSQAWGNTIRKWGALSATTYGVAKVNSAARVLQVLESPDSGKIYDIFGMGSTDGQGFIFDNEYGDKVFRIPLSSQFIQAMTAGLGSGSVKGVDVTTPISSFNLAFSGGQVPGMDAGVLPGFGPMIQVALNYFLTDSQYNSIPEYIRMAVQPYGKSNTNPIQSSLPSWIQKALTAMDSNSPQMMAMTQQLINHKISTEPKYMKLITGNLSIGERKALQAELVETTNGEARSLMLTQAAMQNVLPSTPVLEYFATTKKGSLSQVQLSQSMYQMYQDNGGDWNAAINQYADTFGARALPILIKGYSSSIFATSEAWDFAQSHPDLSARYLDIMPYFFPRDGIFSQSYAKAMRTRRGSQRLTPQEVLAEADSLTANLIKDRLIKKAAINGYDDNWIAEQYKTIVGRKFGAGWNPTVSGDISLRGNRLAAIREAVKDDKMMSTPLGASIKSYLNTRDEYLANSQYKTLAAKANEDIRLALEDYANTLVEQNPDFRWVFNSLFAPELRG